MSDEYRSRQDRRKAQTKSKTKKKTNKGGLFKKILLVLGIVIGLGIISGGIAVFAIIQDAPELKPALLKSSLSTIIYDKDNNEVATKSAEENRIKTDIKDVPPLLKKAFISIEDRRFKQHFGLDIRRIVGAAIEDIQEMEIVEGGSTITQQVVKRAILSPKQTFVRKIQEAWLAIQLEQKYSKAQILEMYLNKICFGQRACGVTTAAKTYFDTKDLSKLNLSQMALLAGLPNAPSAYNPFEHPEKARERRDQVLHAMVETGAITKQQAEKAKAKSIKELVVKPEKENSSEPYKAFIDTVYHQLVEVKEVITKEQFNQGGLKIYTTLDTNAQEHIHHLIKSDEIDFPDKYFETGISLIDTQSGAVRAVGGGRDFLAISYTNHGSQAETYTGSTMKPLIDYGPAIEYLKWSTYHPLMDKKFTYKDGTPIHDFDGEYHGRMTLRNALAYSRNIPALKTFYAVGKEDAVTFAKHLGLEFGKKVFDPVAIGTFEPGSNPMEMAGAYAAFGNEGVYHKPYTVRKIVFPNGKTIEFEHKPKVVMHKYTAYMITDILKSVIDYGTGTEIDLPGIPVAGKTGSVGLDPDLKDKYNVNVSYAYSDEWFIGYTTQYTCAVWTGYPDVTHGGKAYYLHGETIDLAKKIFENIMGTVSGDDVPDWEKPDQVVQVAVEKDTGLLPSEGTPEDDIITELFVKGTQPTKVSDKYKKLEAPKHLEAKYDEKKKQIIITWDYPEDKEHIGFKVAYSVDGGPMQEHGMVGKTKMIIDKPTPGSVYKIQVTAVSSDTKRVSDPVTTKVQIPKEKAALVPPKQLRAKYDKKSDQILLTWTYPERENTAFRIEGSVNGQPMQNLGTTQQTRAIIKDPEPGAVYRFRVTPIDTETGQTGPSAETEVSTPKDKPQEPSVPPGDDGEDGGNGNDGSDGGDGGDTGGSGDGSDDGGQSGDDGNTTEDGNGDGGTLSDLSEKKTE